MKTIKYYKSGRCSYNGNQILNARQIWGMIRKENIQIVGALEYDRLLSILKSVENNTRINLNRVIRAGGFVEYIKRLESAGM